MNANFAYLVRLTDMTYKTFTDYNRAHRIAAVIRSHAKKVGTMQWRCDKEGRTFYTGPGEVIEKRIG